MGQGSFSPAGRDSASSSNCHQGPPACPRLHRDVAPHSLRQAWLSWKTAKSYWKKN